MSRFLFIISCIVFISCTTSREIPHWIGGGYDGEAIAKIDKIYPDRFNNHIIKYFFYVGEKK